MNTDLTSHDSLLTANDWLAERNLPVAIEMKEHLQPSAGADAIIFPPSYARADKEGGPGHPYAIDVLLKDVPPGEAGERIANLCSLDSVGAQANRMEPVFAQTPLNSLVPQVTFAVGSESANLLELGHRLADGVMRFSGLNDQASAAIAAANQTRNAEPLAKLAPTSLVFGMWDSRESQLKMPRIITSTIQATNVDPLKRSAQFVASKAVRAIIDGEREAGTLVADNDPLSKEGLLDAPAVDTHGGVRVHGPIVRRTEINLISLRALAAMPDGHFDATRTLALRRYIFALSLVAATAQSSYNLRQGCLLVRKSGTPVTCKLVRPDGSESEFAFSFEEAYAFAQAAKDAFGVGSNHSGAFDIGKVRDRLEKASSTNAAKRAAKKAAKKQVEETPETGA